MRHKLTQIFRYPINHQKKMSTLNYLYSSSFKRKFMQYFVNPLTKAVFGRDQVETDKLVPCRFSAEPGQWILCISTVSATQVDIAFLPSVIQLLYYLQAKKIGYLAGSRVQRKAQILCLEAIFSMIFASNNNFLSNQLTKVIRFSINDWLMVCIRSKRKISCNVQISNYLYLIIIEDYILQSSRSHENLELINNWPLRLAENSLS